MVDSNPILLKIADLEAVHVIVETKVKELNAVGKSLKPEEHEHKAVKRVIQDLVQILLGYVEEGEAQEIFSQQYGEKFFANAKTTEGTDASP